jgi:hypothetical protein
MAKKLAVLVRERQDEALRVAVGLTLNDNAVEVFVLDRKLEATPAIAEYLGTLRELRMPLATNCADNADLELLSDAAIARRIVRCDQILPY